MAVYYGLPSLLGYNALYVSGCEPRVFVDVRLHADGLCFKLAGTTKW
jgi:hypothetical protein